MNTKVCQKCGASETESYSCSLKPRSKAMGCLPFIWCVDCKDDIVDKGYTVRMVTPK